MNIALLGGGSWGTAVARLLNNNGHNVKFYVRDNQVVEDVNINKLNSKYLKGIDLGTLRATNVLEESVKESDIVVISVPSHAYRDILESIKPILENQIIVNLAKGIEMGSLKRMSEITREILPENKYVILSGPSHAEEVGKDIPTAITVASDDLEVAKNIQEIFSTKNFRVYTSEDLIGVELAGSLKNIIALAAGMSDGLEFGDNTKAALITRGLYEITKLGVQMGANPYTFNGLSGIGDLVVTCTSMHSRNRRAGILIGKGASMEEASMEVGQVVEGIKTTKSSYELSKKYGVNMPITEKLYEVLYCGYDPRKAVYELMIRDYKDEIDSSIFA